MALSLFGSRPLAAARYAWPCLLLLCLPAAGPARAAGEREEGIDYGLVYLAEITDYTEADVKQVFTEETGKEAQEVKIVGAGNPRPELRAVVNKRLQDSGFVITRDWPEARQKGGVRMIFRVLDDRAATKLQAEGAATVFLVPVVGFLSAAKKEARVVMTLEVYGPANDLMWSGRQKKVWKSDFFGGIFRKKAKLRAGATGDCIKLLLAKYDEWIHAQPQGEASEAAQQTTLEKPAAEEKPARTKPSRAKRGPKENPPGSPEH